MDDGDGLTTWRPAPDVVVVRLSGELDIATEPAAREYLRACTRDRPRHLVLDLSEVTFLASHGLRLLVAAALHDDGIHGELHLGGVAPDSHVNRVLRLTGLADRLHVEPDVETLLKALAEG